jgi:predicted unusual protein kinase regulating ubiquinone biosynthesis (AarF/ABC1/UbiB family)/DNA-binding XRE family transcriptional regulator
MKTAQQLKQLREKLGLSQRDMAQEFGVSPGAVAMWENKERPIPGPVLRLIELFEDGLRETPPFTSIEHEKEFQQALKNELLQQKAELAESERYQLDRSVEELVALYLPEQRVLRRLQLSLAQRLLTSGGQTRSLAIKALQTASYFDYRLRDQTRALLLRMKGMGPMMSPVMARRVFEKDLGMSPEQAFARWSRRPFVSASIGQVHRAHLKDGTPVAVKVQHHAMRDSYPSTLRQISAIMRLAPLCGTAHVPFVKECEQYFSAECDYRQEAANQQAFYDNFNGQDGIVVPRVFAEYSSDRVLTTEYIDALTFNDFVAKASQTEKDRAGQQLYTFFYQGIARVGWIQADPHVGNFLFSKRGVAFIDFGRVVKLEPQYHQALRKLFLAVRADDKAAALKAQTEMGLMRDSDLYSFDECYRVMRMYARHSERDENFRFEPGYSKDIWEATRQMSRGRNLEIAGGTFWWLTYALSIFAMLSELKAEANWHQISHRYLA